MYTPVPISYGCEDSHSSVASLACCPGGKGAPAVREGKEKNEGIGSWKSGQCAAMC